MLVSENAPTVSLEDFLENPIDHTEWLNGQLLEKKEMNAKTGRIQARLTRYWGNFQESSGQGGEVYTETPCRTIERVRCPDVAYLTPELVAQHGDSKVLPCSFSLIAEISSPTDEAEEVFTKVREYLASECEEVWLVFPESQWIFVVTSQQQKLHGLNDTVSTQRRCATFTLESFCLNEEVLMFNGESFCLNHKVLNLNGESFCLNGESFCLNEEVLMFNGESFCLNEEALMFTDDTYRLNEEVLNLSNEALNLNTLKKVAHHLHKTFCQGSALP